MSVPETTYQKAQEAIVNGKLWRAKQILQGNFGSQSFEHRLYEQYGQLLLRMGDLLEAGRFLFFSGIRHPDYAESINLFLDTFSRTDKKQILLAGPRNARFTRAEDIPDAVKADLKKLGLNDLLLRKHIASHKRSKTEWVAPIIILVVLLAIFLLGFVFLIKIIIGFFH